MAWNLNAMVAACTGCAVEGFIAKSSGIGVKDPLGNALIKADVPTTD